jgi:hypothetical protein
MLAGISRTYGIVDWSMCHAARSNLLDNARLNRLVHQVLVFNKGKGLSSCCASTGGVQRSKSGMRSCSNSVQPDSQRLLLDVPSCSKGVASTCNVNQQ